MADHEKTLTLKLNFEESDISEQVIESLVNVILASPRLAARISDVVRTESARQGLYLVGASRTKPQSRL